MTKRFTQQRPCPICGGYESDRLRGTGRRCWGYYSDDERFAFCTRTEYSGGLLLSSGSNSYRHRVDGNCQCGKGHGAAPPSGDLQGHRRNSYNGTSSLGTPITHYVYTDASGKPLHRVIRYANPKGFRQQRYHNDEWVWGLQGMRRVLYHLPELVQAPKDQPVFITEGEKDAEELGIFGYLSTTNSDGAGVWRREYCEVLRGRDVVIVEDADEAGFNRTNKLIEQLSPCTSRLRVLCFPNCKEGYDIWDYIQENKGVDNIGTLMYDAKISKLRKALR